MTTRSFPTPRHPARTLAWAAALGLGSWAAQADTVNGANLKVTLDALPGTFSQVVTQGAAGHSILTLSWTGLYNGSNCGGNCPVGAATRAEGGAPGLSHYNSFDLFTTLSVAPLTGWQVNAVTYRIGATNAGETTAIQSGLNAGNTNNAIYTLYKGSGGYARVDYGIASTATLTGAGAGVTGLAGQALANSAVRFKDVTQPVSRDGAPGPGSTTTFGNAAPGVDTGLDVSAYRSLLFANAPAFEYGHAQIAMLQTLSYEKADAAGNLVAQGSGWNQVFSLTPVFSGRASILGNAEASLALGSVSISFDVSQAVPPVPVPEPSSWMLLAAGGAWVWFASRRRR